MKIVYISNNRMPTELANGLQVAQMCGAFSEAGNEVELVVPRRVNSIKQSVFDYYKIKDNFFIKKIVCADLIFLNKGKFFFWLETVTFLLSARIYLFFNRYDILYTREQIAGLFFGNFVLEIHSLPKKITFFHKLIWKKASALVVLTGFIKDRLVSEGVEAKKIMVASDGVDLAKFDIDISKDEARRVLGLPLNKKLIGYVGMLRTLGMEKGLDVAIKALGLLRSQNVSLVLVGGYQKDIDLYKDMAVGLGVMDRLIFVSKVDHGRIPLYLKAFDVLIAPFPETEHYNFYMSPLKIFEYMASKRPIIATNLPSIKEVLNGGNAVLVKPGDEAELAEAMDDILGKKDLSEKLAAKAFVDAGERTWIKRAVKILDFIAKIKII